MTRLVGDNIVIIEQEPDQQCDFCGKVAELRPYGPKGECICHECGMKDEETTTRMILKRFGERMPVAGNGDGTISGIMGELQ